MSCKWYQFHNWKSVYEEYTDTFLGEECPNYVYRPFRKCGKCGIIQKFDSTWGEKGKWITLSNCKSKIFNSKITKENDFIILIKY